MRLTIRTNLAVRVLMHCAVNSGRLVRSADIAESCNASGNHLAQVIHRLQLCGYVDTQRGRQGGLTLSRPASEISMGELFRKFEASVPFTECFDPSSNSCPLAHACRMRRFLARATEAFYRELDEVTLEDLVDGNSELHDLLTLAPREPMLEGCAAQFN
ncbi:Rrf2 family transcriptional regulator [Xinfangfangia sp. CPCC 101601]|uniref:Rrf2 family transcriptional regulator n=1 Tax=Pseudogemmobacter lacusdianii TaxID=3069608 RepID=A0ABU0VU34_9RHOB|nr:Rrf2 family transcriptional regulator [Xinfangfangia sp. CPCC 101601]MDQ2065242.1 Rrf2 family transcriptional regulator [Xinfangfangia sp. CPCC 101601]